MTFKQEIQKLFFDKILLGGVIAIAIYFGSIKMEEIKANENFKSKLNSVRISKIAEVWEKANDFEINFYKLYDAVEKEKILMKFRENNLTEKDIFKKENLTSYILTLNKSRAELMKVLHKNSFYLGEKLEKQVFDFYKALAVVEIYQKINLDTKLLNITGSVSSISIEKAKRAVDSFKANISQIRNYIINGGL